MLKTRPHAFACDKIFNLGCCTRTSNSLYLQYKLNDHLVEYIETGAVCFSCSQLLILGETGAFEGFQTRPHAFACYKIFNLGCCTRTGNSSYLQYKLNENLIECIETGAVRFICSQLLILGEKGAFQVLKIRPHALTCYKCFNLDCPNNSLYLQ